MVSTGLILFIRGLPQVIYVGFTFQDIDNYDNVEMTSLH